jgi:hypothetical protein
MGPTIPHRTPAQCGIVDHQKNRHIASIPHGAVRSPIFREVRHRGMVAVFGLSQHDLVRALRPTPPPVAGTAPREAEQLAKHIRRVTQTMWPDGLSGLAIPPAPREALHPVDGWAGALGSPGGPGRAHREYRAVSKSGPRRPSWSLGKRAARLAVLAVGSATYGTLGLSTSMPRSGGNAWRDSEAVHQ